MKVLTIVLSCIVITACSNLILLRTGSGLPSSRSEVAHALYAVAETCWSKPGNAFSPGVVVDNKVTLDSVIISVRFKSFGWALHAPFLKFIVTGGNTQSHIALKTQEISWRGEGQYMADARRWLRGKFTCSRNTA